MNDDAGLHCYIGSQVRRENHFLIYRAQPEKVDVLIADLQLRRYDLNPLVVIDIPGLIGRHLRGKHVTLFDAAEK